MFARISFRLLYYCVILYKKLLFYTQKQLHKVKNNKLELSFSSKNLRKICESDVFASRVFGADSAENLKHRIADIRAAKNVFDLLVGNPRGIPSAPHFFVINFTPDKQIMFTPSHPKKVISQGLEINWSVVNRIKITEIGGTI